MYEYMMFVGLWLLIGAFLASLMIRCYKKDHKLTEDQISFLCFTVIAWPMSLLMMFLYFFVVKMPELMELWVEHLRKPNK